MADVNAVLSMLTKGSTPGVTPQPADRVIIVRGAESTSSVSITSTSTQK